MSNVIGFSVLYDHLKDLLKDSIYFHLLERKKL